MISKFILIFFIITQCIDRNIIFRLKGYRSGSLFQDALFMYILHNLLKLLGSVKL